jgi:hypothetical protein
MIQTTAPVTAIIPKTTDVRPGYLKPLFDSILPRQLLTFMSESNL